MKITVLVDGCQGHGICYGICPEVLTPDADGFAKVATAEIEAGVFGALEDAVMSCPEGAIRLSDTN
ncbi:ferredoxin [uncultured Jatrophihabitans sp.]|uniref:ferredoxin n=1 Tax=uncultured Jatrophihabitans sp. TaxID=1610747 RepID=UPI0035C95111